jgi:hypothetical protein
MAARYLAALYRLLFTLFSLMGVFAWSFLLIGSPIGAEISQGPARAYVLVMPLVFFGVCFLSGLRVLPYRWMVRAAVVVTALMTPVFINYFAAGGEFAQVALVLLGYELMLFGWVLLWHKCGPLPEVMCNPRAMAGQRGDDETKGEGGPPRD